MRPSPSSRYDRCQETLDQFQSFVAMTLSPTEYAELLPTVGELCGKYGLEPEVAFFVARPALTLLKPTAAAAAAAAAAPAAAAAAAKSKDARELIKEAKEAKEGGDKDGKDGKEGKEAAAAAAVVVVPPEEAQQIRDVLPAASWELISPQLYYTFWSLSLYVGCVGIVAQLPPRMAWHYSSLGVAPAVAVPPPPHPEASSAPCSSLLRLPGTTSSCPRSGTTRRSSGCGVPSRRSTASCRRLAASPTPRRRRPSARRSASAASPARTSSSSSCRSSRRRTPRRWARCASPTARGSRTRSTAAPTR